MVWATEKECLGPRVVQLVSALPANVEIEMHLLNMKCKGTANDGIQNFEQTQFGFATFIFNNSLFFSFFLENSKH